MKIAALALTASLLAGAAMAQTAPGVAPSPTVGASAKLVRVSAVNLYGFDLTQGATAGYFAFLNAAAIPASGATISPVACIPVAVASQARFRQDVPDFYTTGLVIVDTSSATCTTYTPVTSALISASVQ